MAQIVLQTPWIADSFFNESNPVTAVIYEVEQVMNDYGKYDTVLEVVNKDEHVRWTIYGPNLRKLVESYGNETDGWKGKRIRISQTQVDGKKKRFLECLG